MQKGTKQTEEARVAIAEQMRKHWDTIPFATRSAIAKRNAAKRKLKIIDRVDIKGNFPTK